MAIVKVDLSEWDAQRDKIKSLEKQLEKAEESKEKEIEIVKESLNKDIQNLQNDIKELKNSSKVIVKKKEEHIAYFSIDNVLFEQEIIDLFYKIKEGNIRDKIGVLNLLKETVSRLISNSTNYTKAIRGHCLGSPFNKLIISSEDIEEIINFDDVKDTIDDYMKKSMENSIDIYNRKSKNLEKSKKEYDDLIEEYELKKRELEKLFRDEYIEKLNKRDEKIEKLEQLISDSRIEKILNENSIFDTLQSVGYKISKNIFGQTVLKKLKIN